MPMREDLGVKELINADSMKTLLGGTLMAPSVLDAMRNAAESYVDMHELQRAVGKRLANLTHNEAAFVCTGASAGLILATLACITGRDMNMVGTAIRDGVASFPRRDFVVQCGHRNPYDPAIVLAGGRLVQVGNVLQTFAWELEAAITPATAGVLYFAGKHLGFGALELEEVVRIAHAADVPVIVDAAAQLPPQENLWSFTKRGADLVIFSGGKELRGPQASGLIVGRRDLIEACALHASPNQRLARAMKVGKEEMLGLLAAVELYMTQDDADELARCERIVTEWVDALGSLPGVSAERSFPGTDGRPLPRAVISFDSSMGLTGASVQAALLSGRPAIAVAVADPRAIYLNPELLRTGEEKTVLDRVSQVVGRGTPVTPS
jgi:uncharacterized pyridoxal phosphate-dependent enzyme